MASIAAFVYFWSSAYEVSGCCTTDTLYPSFMRMLATASQPEPSAKAPCTRTTFLICLVMTISLEVKDPVGRFVEMRHRGHDVLAAVFSYRSKRGLTSTVRGA